MRRIFAILLCLLVLCGCGQQESAQQESTADTTGTTNTEGTKPSGTEVTLPSGTDQPSDTTPDQPSDTTPDQPSDTTPDQPSDTTPDQPADTTPDTPPSQEPVVDELALYNALFNLNNKIEIDIDMSNAELQKMQDDYTKYNEMGSKSPIYRRANVTITINGTAYYIPDVGVRMKGNTSRANFYKTENGGIYRAIHLKLDFQETFDDEEYYGAEAQQWPDKDARKARKNRTFATLEKLELRWNKCYDSTYLRELYAYELYRSEGVMAPLTNLCSMDWSNAHMGVYTINEPVDEVFLAKRLPAAAQGGDLYKCGWTYEGASLKNTNSIGIEDEDNCKFYCYDLKTNKKTSQHQALTTLIKALNSSTLTQARFEELVDLDSFLSYAAVSYFLGNPDDLRNNYNNYYIYFRADNGKAVIIPYDYDRCLGITVDYNPSGHAMTTDNPFSDKREGAQGGPQTQDVPLFSLTVVKGGWYVQEYADVLTRVSKNTLLTENTFGRYYDRAKRLYGNDVNPSIWLKNADGRDFSFDLNRTSAASAGDNMSFADYLKAKMKTFNSYMAKLDQYLNYERPAVSSHYIRGDFNGWTNEEQYAMKNEKGLMTFTLTMNKRFSFKVYDNGNGWWYGAEFLPEDGNLLYKTDGHGNINLPAGTYYITFNPETEVLTVVKK